MPVCAKKAESRARFLPLLSVVALLVLTACSAGREEGAFTIERAKADWANGRITVHFNQDLRLSQEAQTALVHGVPITLETEMILRVTATRTRVTRHRSRHVIRYLPLSEHYQLSNGDGEPVRTFPRLRHLLAALGETDISFETGALPSGEYELLIRTYLDKKAMPPPMRLPTLFSSRWNHESDWSAWSLMIEPGA